MASLSEMLLSSRLRARSLAWRICSRGLCMRCSWAISANGSSEMTHCPAMASMKSPDFSPAFSAGELGATATTCSRFCSSGAVSSPTRRVVLRFTTVSTAPMP
jgi:hypothetical protein